MRFTYTDDQRDFAGALQSLLAASDTVSVARAWACGDTEPGRKLLGRLAEQGVQALLIPEHAGGMGATPVELTIAFTAIGRHAVPGPLVESAAFLPAALTDSAMLQSIAEGAIATVAAPPLAPLALDADIAEHVFTSDGTRLNTASVGAAQQSHDRTRRLFHVTAGDAVESADLERAVELAALATSAQLLGLGERVLEDSVTYVKQRRQFGREIGSYQAIKHALADVRIALDFARPVIEGAALGAISPSAAKVAASDAAYLAARTGLQVHGAIGYTAEFDLSIWLTKIRALVSAWGAPDHHRAILLEQVSA